MSNLSVTRWLHELTLGSDEAAKLLWDYLRGRLMGVARKRLGSYWTTAFDEEDVALSGFHSLCKSVRDGRYDVEDRRELWRLGAAIVVNKARVRMRNECRLRRGGGLTRHDSGVLESITCSQPDARTTLQMQEECQRLLSLLMNRDLQAVALLKVEGYTNKQVATRLGCTQRAIQRRLIAIRKIWSFEQTHQ